MAGHSHHRMHADMMEARRNGDFLVIPEASALNEEVNPRRQIIPAVELTPIQPAKPFLNEDLTKGSIQEGYPTDPAADNAPKAADIQSLRG